MGITHKVTDKGKVVGEVNTYTLMDKNGNPIERMDPVKFYIPQLNSLKERESYVTDTGENPKKIILESQQLDIEGEFKKKPSKAKEHKKAEPVIAPVAPPPVSLKQDIKPEPKEEPKISDIFNGSYRVPASDPMPMRGLGAMIGASAGSIASLLGGHVSGFSDSDKAMAGVGKYYAPTKDRMMDQDVNGDPIATMDYDMVGKEIWKNKLNKAGGRLGTVKTQPTQFRNIDTGKLVDVFNISINEDGLPTGVLGDGTQANFSKLVEAHPTSTYTYKDELGNIRQIVREKGEGETLVDEQIAKSESSTYGVGPRVLGGQIQEIGKVYTEQGKAENAMRAVEQLKQDFSDPSISTKPTAMSLSIKKLAGVYEPGKLTDFDVKMTQGFEGMSVLDIMNAKLETWDEGSRERLRKNLLEAMPYAEAHARALFPTPKINEKLQGAMGIKPPPPAPPKEQPRKPLEKSIQTEAVRQKAKEIADTSKKSYKEKAEEQSIKNRLKQIKKNTENGYK